MSALLLTAAALLALLAAHPFTTYPLSLALLRRWRSGPHAATGPGGEASPAFSLLVCAHNEARVIEGKLANLQALLDRAPGRAEALVYVDGSTDETADRLRACADPRITAVISAVRTGKTAGLNRLVAMARGDILVLSDANVIVETDALARLARRFADPEVGLVCGHLRYVNDRAGATARNGAVYWRLEELIRQLESDTGGAIGADGSLYAVRRALWPAVPDDLIDDFYVPMTVSFKGSRVLRAGEVLAYERAAEDADDEFRRKVRIACQAFNVHRRLWPLIRRQPALDVYKYISHKLLKWLAGFHLAMATACLLAAAGLALDWQRAAVAAVLAGLVALVGRTLRLPPALAAWDALSMLAAVAVGVLRSFRGERFQTWQPAHSVRLAPMPIGPDPTTASDSSAERTPALRRHP